VSYNKLSFVITLNPRFFIFPGVRETRHPSISFREPSERTDRYICI